MATSRAAASPASAAQWALTRSTASITKIVASGSSATSADSPRLPPIGSRTCLYTCVSLVVRALRACVADGRGGYAADYWSAFLLV